MTATTLPLRLRAQVLTGRRASRPEEVVDRLLAVQAQDPRGARLAIRSRAAEVTAADVDTSLTDHRSLVVSWLNRGTLHLVRAEDYWWLHPLTTPQLAAGSARRLAQEGVSPGQAERGIDVMTEEMGARGPRTRDELRAALDASGVPTAGQALVHVLFAAALRGGLVRGPVRDGQHCFVAPGEWLGKPPDPQPRPEALARLARRYLAGHGPAGAPDLARWAGITLGAARQGLAGIAGETVEDTDGLVDLTAREPAAGLTGPTLLGAFDPLLHGWVSRDAVLGPHGGIVTSNGVFHPFALVDGRAVALWGLAGGRVTIRPLEPVARRHLQALERDAVEVLRYLGLPPAPTLVAP